MEDYVSHHWLVSTDATHGVMRLHEADDDAVNHGGNSSHQMNTK